MSRRVRLIAFAMVLSTSGNLSASLRAQAGSEVRRLDAFVGKWRLTDTSVTDMVKLGQSTRYRSKMGLLVGMISHANEQYGYMAVYLRLKGIVPPSSEGPQ